MVLRANSGASYRGTFINVSGNATSFGSADHLPVRIKVAAKPIVTSIGHRIIGRRVAIQWRIPRGDCLGTEEIAIEARARLSAR